MKRKNREPGSKNSAKSPSRTVLHKHETTTAKSTWVPPDTKKAPRLKNKAAVRMERMAELEQLQALYNERRAGYREENRSFIARAARWALSNRDDLKLVDQLKHHEFWEGKKAPKNVMQAAMVFMDGRHSKSANKIAQKRQRVVDFALDEGCEPENLEEALKEGIEQIYSRAAQSQPKRKKKEAAEAETKGDKPSKPKRRPVYFTGTAVEKLNGLQNGDRIRVTMEVEDVEQRLLKIVKAVPLTK